jgi:hypothetical protein
MRSSEKAWAALVVGVIGYELLAKDDELLSHQVDRWLVAHPVATATAVTITAAHLLNILPQWADPWVWAFASRRLV